MHPLIAVDIHETIRTVAAEVEDQLRATGSEIILRLVSVPALVPGKGDLVGRLFRDLFEELLQSSAENRCGFRLTLRSHLSPRSFYIVIELVPTSEEVARAPLKALTGDLSRLYNRIKQALKRLNGDMRILQWNGGSLALVLRLPVTKSSCGLEALRLPRKPVFSGERILVVDDEEVVLDLLEAVLGRWGLQVETAADGQEALEKLRSHTFDLILSDIKMPNLDGKGLHSAVRDLQPGLADRIIFSTGDTASEATTSFLDRVGNPYLSKPFDMEDLKLTIARMLALNHESSPNA